MGNLTQNHLSLDLIQHSMRELLNLDKSPVDFYALRDNKFRLLVPKGEALERDSLVSLIKKGVTHLYSLSNERNQVIEVQQENLRNLTRSLSIGDPVDKGRKILTSLSINMKYLYENPSDDQALNLQFQSIRGLASFLINNHDIHGQLFSDYSKQIFPYLYAQPMLASLFLVGILKQVRILSDKEITSLFQTSYFKDIGMSMVPSELIYKKDLTKREVNILRKHPDYSIKILQGRVPLTSNYLKIIENHHRFSLLEPEALLPEHQQTELLISGFESVVVSITDIIAAMINERPYRSATSLFEALELTKNLIADSYSQEFKVIISYFKQHFIQK